MKNNYIFKVTTSLILLFFIGVTTELMAQTMETINVSEDTYVRGDSNADDNYGTETIAYARDTTISIPRITYLKFPVSGTLPTSVTSATLKFYSFINSSSTDTETLEIYKRDSDAWNEASVTYNNRPLKGAFINNVTVAVGPTNPAPYTMYSLDVTAYFNEVLAASGTAISFAIKPQPTDIGGGDRYVRIGTKENTSETVGSYIEIEYVALGVDDFSSNASPLNIYPNPANANFTLRKSFNSPDSLEISIFNLLGQKVASLSETVQPGVWKKTFNKTELNLKTGIYLVKVSSDEHGNSSSTKIVIN
jgi:hypothetical protein